MNAEKFIVDVCFDEEDGTLVKLPNFSRWFTQHQLNPEIGEHLFVPDGNTDFKEEEQHSGSNEWYISSKYYQPENNTIIIWCKDFCKNPPPKGEE